MIHKPYMMNCLQVGTVTYIKDIVSGNNPHTEMQLYVEIV